jgi:regulator of protease activity HflC (stomatin/prohibitin superfamily)
MNSLDNYRKQLEKQRLEQSNRYEQEKKLQQEKEWKKLKSELAIGCSAAVIALIILTLLLSIYTVPAGNVGIVTRFGAVLYTAQPGFGMKVPFIDGVVWMDTRTQLESVDASAASSDLQDVNAKIATNFRLDPAYALWMYQNVGTDYKEKIISPAIQNAFKAVNARFTAEQLIQKRDLVSSSARELLATELGISHVLVDNFNIINFEFSKEFNAAIEQKQVAQQEVQTSEQRLAKARIEAQQKVVEAQAQADAQKALKDTGALSNEYLQFLAINKWDGKLPTVTGGGATPLLDLNKLVPATK